MAYILFSEDELRTSIINAGIEYINNQDELLNHYLYNSTNLRNSCYELVYACEMFLKGIYLIHFANQIAHEVCTQSVGRHLGSLVTAPDKVTQIEKVTQYIKDNVAMAGKPQDLQNMKTVGLRNFYQNNTLRLVLNFPDEQAVSTTAPYSGKSHDIKKMFDRLPQYLQDIISYKTSQASFLEDDEMLTAYDLINMFNGNNAMKFNPFCEDVNGFFNNHRYPDELVVTEEHFKRAQALAIGLRNVATTLAQNNDNITPTANIINYYTINNGEQISPYVLALNDNCQKIIDRHVNSKMLLETLFNGSGFETGPFTIEEVLVYYETFGMLDHQFYTMNLNFIKNSIYPFFTSMQNGTIDNIAQVNALQSRMDKLEIGLSPNFKKLINKVTNPEALKSSPDIFELEQSCVKNSIKYKDYYAGYQTTISFLIAHKVKPHNRIYTKEFLKSINKAVLSITKTYEKAGRKHYTYDLTPALNKGDNPALVDEKKKVLELKIVILTAYIKDAYGISARGFVRNVIENNPDITYESFIRKFDIIYDVTANSKNDIDKTFRFTKSYLITLFDKSEKDIKNELNIYLNKIGKKAREAEEYEEESDFNITDDLYYISESAKKESDRLISLLQRDGYPNRFISVYIDRLYDSGNINKVHDRLLIATLILQMDPELKVLNFDNSMDLIDFVIAIEDPHGFLKFILYNVAEDGYSTEDLYQLYIESISYGVEAEIDCSIKDPRLLKIALELTDLNDWNEAIYTSAVDHLDDQEYLDSLSNCLIPLIKKLKYCRDYDRTILFYTYEDIVAKFYERKEYFKNINVPVNELPFTDNLLEFFEILKLTDPEEISLAITLFTEVTDYYNFTTTIKTTLKVYKDKALAEKYIKKFSSYTLLEYLIVVRTKITNPKLQEKYYNLVENITSPEMMEDITNGIETLTSEVADEKNKDELLELLADNKDASAIVPRNQEYPLFKDDIKQYIMYSKYCKIYGYMEPDIFKFIYSLSNNELKKVNVVYLIENLNILKRIGELPYKIVNGKVVKYDDYQVIFSYSPKELVLFLSSLNGLPFNQDYLYYDIRKYDIYEIANRIGLLQGLYGQYKGKTERPFLKKSQIIANINFLFTMDFSILDIRRIGRIVCTYDLKTISTVVNTLRKYGLAMKDLDESLFAEVKKLLDENTKEEIIELTIVKKMIKEAGESIYYAELETPEESDDLEFYKEILNTENFKTKEYGYHMIKDNKNQTIYENKKYKK